ncbi:hypothetical protein EDEG_00006 [Edhazardia aedis USNM 41457]|uniref:Uncharacterized protein n=1 Tax=Edhazardia aedis (strain USNM 41457) TaxID=1003232 RepID=J9DVT8_EDHAE|nr:hypothetical protein EDEG_00006 [Edhazardia aedis USNM 41457]|eukprot:EJW05397.1 hypothetical protein EDEG_00006 [Edhazardia aedis USNM 41457]
MSTASISNTKQPSQASSAKDQPNEEKENKKTDFVKKIIMSLILPTIFLLITLSFHIVCFLYKVYLFHQKIWSYILIPLFLAMIIIPFITLIPRNTIIQFAIFVMGLILLAITFWAGTGQKIYILGSEPIDHDKLVGMKRVVNLIIDFYDSEPGKKERYNIKEVNEEILRTKILKTVEDNTLIVYELENLFNVFDIDESSIRLIECTMWSMMAKQAAIILRIPEYLRSQIKKYENTDKAFKNILVKIVNSKKK